MLRDSKLRFDRLSPFTRYATIGAVLLCGLLVAGVRGPGGSAPALAEEPKQPVAVIDAEKASDTAQSESIKTFEARLPSGITVELLGVSENPSKNKFWWRPDGSPLAERPYDSLGNVHYSDQLHVPREFAILLHNLPSEPVGTLLEFDPTYDAAGGGKPKLLGKYTGELYVESVSLPNKPTVTVRFAIADGPWTTACESEQSAFIGTSTGGFGFSPAIEKDDGLIITVTHDIIHPDTRVIALDMAGKEHYASSSGGGGAHNFRQITATFSKLALKDVKTFCLQTRPYKWVEFRNVSLRAGQKTDVQVVQLAELNKPATEEKQSQQPKPQRLYPNDIDSEAAGKRALEKYDTNKDGKISGPELDKAPALKSAMETMHTNRGNGITADDIAARIKAWQATKVVLIGSIACNVIRNGKPVEGVEVKFVPDDFLGENMQTATGITGQDGFARMSIPQKSPDDVSGVAPGFYLVEITKPGEDIPAKYNSQTIFGLEIAPDVSLSKPFKPFVFDIGANRATFDKEASRNNLKQLSVAMLMYYDRYKHYPPAAFYFRRGNTPHSWRVALLPLLGQEDLYKQYNLDEPWDSPNNLKVLENMPDVFRNPTDKADSKNAAYFALVGSGTMFEEKDVSESKAGTKLQDVKDGTAHTILLVEAKRDIPWTKPEDIAYDPEKPLPELGGYFDDGFHTVFADGSVHFIPKTISENVMRLLINKADRQRVEVPSEAR